MIEGARFLALILSAGFLSSCGGEDGGTRNDTSPAAPTTYSIYPSDLYREVPKDFCRSLDPEFLRTLIKRARQGVPVQLGGSFKFEDFSVTDGYEGKNREAILRFTVSDGRTPPTMMYAVGAFDPNGCRVAELRVGEGPSPYAASNPQETRVP